MKFEFLMIVFWVICHLKVLLLMAKFQVTSSQVESGNIIAAQH